MNKKLTISIREATMLLVEVGLSKNLKSARKMLGRRRKCDKSGFVKNSRNGFHRVAISSLPSEVQEKYHQNHYVLHSTSEIIKGSELSPDDVTIYAAAPEYNKRIWDKYCVYLCGSLAHLEGNALREYLKIQGNKGLNPPSPSSIYENRRKYLDRGIEAVLGKFGKRSVVTSVPDDLFSYFKSLYLCDSKPSAVSCWKITLGYATKNGFEVSNVPHHLAFMRRLRSEVPKEAVFTAREGVSAADKKYGFYLKRDYRDILAGECWISDHAQLDVACEYQEGGNKKIGYPWITAWRDFKSGIWLSWDLHMEPPCSDHIFLTTYRAGKKHGIPLFMYLDNGKDYRCKSFAGGRNHHKLNIDESKMITLTAGLGIKTIFAWPYNAQSKAIERDFLRNKEWFSMHNPGYRGGNVVERPENHEKKKKSGVINTLDEIREMLAQFIEEVVMLTPISSGYRAGKCPREIWDEEYPEALRTGKVRCVSKQALMLFCTTTSSVRQIGRRGIPDSELGVNYYDHWMEGQRGRKVYLRRDPMAMQEAYVFDAATHAYINNAYLLNEVGALATDDISRRELKEQIKIKRASKRLINIASKPDLNIDFSERQAMMVIGTKAINVKRGYTPKQTDKIPAASTILTHMDHVAAEAKRRKKSVKYDEEFMKALTEGDESYTNEEKLFLFDYEKEEYEERKRREA